MKRLFLKCGLAAVYLAGLLTAGCAGDEQADFVWDFYNPSVVFFVRDAATGADLLDPEAPEALGSSAVAVYRGVRYEAALTEYPYASPLRTRYNPPRGLCLQLYRYASEPSRYCLDFGEFSPVDDHRDEELTIEWGDRTVSTVRFDLYITWKRNEPTVHRTIRLDGELLPGDEGYGAWRIDIPR